MEAPKKTPDSRLWPDGIFYPVVVLGLYVFLAAQMPGWKALYGQSKLSRSPFVVNLALDTRASL
ncbi:MAG TPA: hypothetical protein VE981_15455 [Planctomycetota bacterium]|nr:hypothetical protein [Planctomycetota bacterium]